MLSVIPLYAQEEDYGFKADEVDKSIFESDPAFESNYQEEAFKRGNGNGQGGNGNGNNGNGKGNQGDAPAGNQVVIFCFSVFIFSYGYYLIHKKRSTT